MLIPRQTYRPYICVSWKAWSTYRDDDYRYGRQHRCQGRRRCSRWRLCTWRHIFGFRSINSEEIQFHLKLAEEKNIFTYWSCLNLEVICKILMRLYLYVDF